MKLKPKSRQLFYVSATLLNLFSMGLMYGYPAVLIPHLKNKNSDVQASLETISWIVAIPGISALVMNILAGPLMNSWGRKKAHLLITICGLIGWILAASSYSIYSILISRVFHGILKGGNIFFTICIAEYTSPDLRGTILTLNQLSYIAATATVHTVGIFIHWRYLALIGVFTSTSALLINLIWTETPEWLVFKQRFDEAECTFYKLRHRNSNSKEEIKKMIAKVQEKQTEKKSILTVLKSKSFWTVTAIATTKQIISEFGGRHYFPAFLIEMITDITGDNSRVFIYVIIIDSMSIVMTFISVFLIKIFSRRSLLINAGCFGVLMLFGFSITLYLFENLYSVRILFVASLVFLGLYFAIVYGSIFTVLMVLSGEIWPLEYRHIGIVYQSLISSITFTIWMKSVPYLNLYLHVYGMFAVVAVIILISILHLYKYLPETQNKTLHDIGEHFEENKTRIHEEQNDFLQKKC